MTRRETTATSFERTTMGARLAAPALERTPSVWVGLAGSMILVAAFQASLANAEPASLPDVSAPPPAAMRLADESPPKEPIRTLRVAPEVAEPERVDLTDLLDLPGVERGTWRPRTADERLAVAVAAGTQPDLEPPKPFRKKSRDLLRAERPLTIGTQDLVMRLRLRAKAREAVSVEFHF